MGVKSAERALAILEYLRQRSPAPLGEISAALGLPNSSASVLLKTLVTAGYVSQCDVTRGFRQTARVALLGAGPTGGADDAQLRAALDRIHQLTGETVVVGQQSGAFVRYVHLIDTKHQLLQRLPVDQMRLMSYNPLGHVLSAELAEPRVRSILRHNNAHASAPAERLDEKSLLAQIMAIRSRGYAEGPGRTWPSARILAMTIHPDHRGPPLAVGVGGPGVQAKGHRNDVLACMRDELAPWH
jgi:DNA-binding IclR family transcriptional regulator